MSATTYVVLLYFWRLCLIFWYPSLFFYFKRKYKQLVVWYKRLFFFYFFVTKFVVFILAKKWMRLQVKLFVLKFFVCVDFLSFNLFFFRCWYACFFAWLHWQKILRCLDKKIFVGKMEKRVTSCGQNRVILDMPAVLFSSIRRTCLNVPFIT